MTALATEEDCDAEQPHHKAYLFFRLGAGATLGTRRPNRFVLRNADYTGDRLIDNVDDGVFDKRQALSWHFS